MTIEGKESLFVSGKVFAEASKPLPDAPIPNYFKRAELIGADSADVHAGEAEVKSVLTTLARNSEHIAAFRQRADSRITFADFQHRVEKEVDKFADDGFKALARAQRSAASAVAAREAEIEAAVDIAEPKGGAEIRAALRGMTKAERQKAIQAATNPANPDKEIIGAVRGYNPITHGVDMPQFDAMVDALKRKLAPMAYRNLDNARATAKMADEAELHLRQFTQRAYKGTPKYDKKLAETVSVLESYDFKYED